jgi:spermidine synthase
VKSARTWTIVCTAALAGACTMVLELAAVRLLAPWFGTSATVWTNVIGVILLALSTGYFLGARLSARGDPWRALALVLLGGGLLCVKLPDLAAPVARLFLPENLTLEETGRLLQWGSLATAIVLFLPATFLLGCVTPLCTELVQRVQATNAGRAGGWVLGASTLGSLAGTFGTTSVLVPGLGSRWTFQLAAAVLFLLGASIWMVGLRSRARAAAVLLVLVGVGAVPLGSAKGPAAADERVLEARESRYQNVRVVERTSDGVRARFLEVNEKLGSFQSVWQETPGFLPEGYYYNLFAMPAWWARRQGTWRLAVLGLGAGTTWRVFQGALPPDVTLESTGVEIDPVVVELAERWMDLPAADPRLRVLSGWDARLGLRHSAGALDQIVLDAYQNQIEIPQHLSTAEFFGECHAKLADGGWMSVNVGAFGLWDPVVEALARTLAFSFNTRVLAVRVPFSRNCVVFARKAAEVPDPGGASWLCGASSVDRRLSAMTLPGMWRWIDAPPRPDLTDERNPIEELQRRSILGAERHAVGAP